MSVQSHMDESRALLQWAWRALEFEDLRGATGRAWAATVEATKAVAESRNLACKSPADVYGVAYAILREVKDEKMDDGFSWAETLHTESLQDYLLESEIELGIKGVTDFVEGVAACLNVGAASAGKSAD